MNKKCPQCQSSKLFLAIAEMYISGLDEIIYCTNCDQHFSKFSEESKWLSYSPTLTVLKNFGCICEVVID